MSANTLGSVDAIYDRATLVALPATLRQEYARHLVMISASAKQLLISFDYPQSLMAGPPFSISEATLAQLYAGFYRYEELERRAVAGKLKGQVDATEVAWLLEPLNRD